MSWVFAAYTVVFVAFFIYAWSLGSRQKNLEKKLEDLKELLKDTSKRN